MDVHDTRRNALLPPLDSEYAVSEEQVARFWQDGFIVLPGVLSDEEVADAEEFLGGRSEGELADSELNTIVFSTY